MVHLLPWIERQWSFSLPVGAFPAVLERLAGTPARAAALAVDVPEAILATRLTGKWSVKEHIGHLSDLHALDMRRVAEFVARAEVLSAGDMTNRVTEEANHRAAPVSELLAAFRQRRQRLTARLERLTETEVAITALHPRLGVPMRVIDWVQFVAEHDDHHLAAARVMLRAVERKRTR